MYRLSALLLASLLVAAPALAGEPEKPGVARTIAKRMRTEAQTVGDPESARPTVLNPISGVRATAFPTPSLGVWAQGHGFALSRRSALYDVEGGASWSIDDGVHLFASYRLLGIDLGFDSDVEGMDVEPGISAPFLGLAFDF